MRLKSIIENDIIALVTTNDSDNRGLSDKMLYILNSYFSTKGVISDMIRKKLLTAANLLIDSYNKSQPDSFGILFFELYYTLLKKFSKKSKSSVPLNEITNFEIVSLELPIGSREFIKLYYSFGVYWGQRVFGIREHIKRKCREAETRGIKFVPIMDKYRREIIDGTVKEGLSWTHNHYGYFSTLFFTQKTSRELRINARKYSEYLKKTLDFAVKESMPNYDYIGECVEQLIFYSRNIDYKYIQILLKNSAIKNRIHHNLVTASIVPFAVYLKRVKKTKINSKRITSRYNSSRLNT